MKLVASPQSQPQSIGGPFSSGDVIDQKYRVERVLGRGGMGIILEATHLQLDERVALKVLRPDLAQNDEIVARFAREARAAAKLKSEHVARVRDVGVFQGMPFMVMELLVGADLADNLQREQALSPSVAADYLIQACEGVSEAHARGIVHRDLKPENLFVVDLPGGASSIKVLDFGISKAALTGRLTDVDLTTSETKNMMGSPYYMSPEQLRSTRLVDHRADIWSLGVVLYECLTGAMAFEPTAELTELVARILESPHRRPEKYTADLPEGLVAVIDRCLEKDPAKRFQTAAELALALVPYAHRRSLAIAERAVRTTQASDLREFMRDVRVPSSVAPPPMAGSPLRVQGGPGAPPEARDEVVTMIGPVGASQAAAARLASSAPPSSTPATDAAVSETGSPTWSTSKHGLLALLLLLPIAGVAAWFFGWRTPAATSEELRTGQPPALQTTATPAADGAATPSAHPLLSADPAPPTEEVASGEPVAAATSSSTPAHTRPPISHPTPPPKHTSKQPATAAPLDIRMTR